MPAPVIKGPTTFSFAGTSEAGAAWTLAFTKINDPASIRWAYTLLDGNPVFMNNIFHPPGVDGNIVITNGRTAKRFDISVIYAGNLADLLTAYEADTEALSYGPITITDDKGRVWTRCRLEGMNRERPQGCDIGAFFMSHLQFTCHGGKSTATP